MITHFREDTLGSVFDFYNGKAIKPGGLGQYLVFGSNGIIGKSDEYKYENAIIIGRVGAYCGSVVLSKKPFWASDNTIVAKPKSEETNISFAYYLLKTLNLNFYAGGAAQPLLTQTVLNGINTKIPPLPLQNKIASILSAYDDLIENNTRRIMILEEMAQRIYREWFVNFRFPGHQNVKMVESELGMIPEGWEVKTFTDIAHVLSGGTPKTTAQEYWDGEIPFFCPKDASDNIYLFTTEKKITQIGLSKCNSKLYAKDTVFITARGTVGKVIMPAVDMAMNQSCYALIGKPGIMQFYLFLLTKNQVEYLKKNTGGATFDTIIVDTFQRMKVIKPIDSLITNFVSQVNPIFGLIEKLISKNQNLLKTRDLLLPKLISGQIDVSDIGEAET